MGLISMRALFSGITITAISILLFWYYEMQLHFGFKIAFGATLFLYLLIPALFHFIPSVQRGIVFLPFVRWPKDVNFDAPDTEGIYGGRNVYLKPESDISIGVWHFLPKSLVKASKSQPGSFWDDSLRTSGKNIIIYFHGNSGSRAGEHRKELYTILQEMDCHVICFDYRGYADSSQVSPSETGTITDGTFVYKWVRGIIGNNSAAKIFIWGHSLGTGVSTHMVSNLITEGDVPVALVLEAPFTSLGEEVKNHMLSLIYRYMPFFDYIFVEPLRRNDIEFQTDRHIANIHIPILILHAIDDPVIPYMLGEKLYKTAKEIRPKDSKPIYFKGFGEGYAHKFICRAPNLAEYITSFFNCALTDSWPCTPLIGDGEMVE